jgi:putative Mn2+ efflux pump MntP
MKILEIILIAISLSMDCFAVSISSGGTMKFLNIPNMIKMAFMFGFFQGIMPLIGYFAGVKTIRYIERFDHWIAFLILFILGIKMIYESYKLDELNCDTNRTCPFGFKTLIILSVATSIDALSIGFTFSIIKTPLIISVTLIALISFLMSIIGINIGYKGKHFFENKIEKIAGFILILLGLKIIVSHI